LSAGVYPTLDAVPAATRVEKRFPPQINEATRQRMTSAWEDAVGRSRQWAVPRG
jgi:glycerol kinase